jgi:hypothetical protein
MKQLTVTYIEVRRMERGAKEHKNNFNVNFRPILLLLIGLGFFTVILLTAMMTVPKQPNLSGSSLTQKQNDGQEPQQEDSSDNTLLAIVKGIDTEKKQITLFDINEQKPYILDYTGGTNITDQYGQVIAVSQVEPGSMVDAVYRKDKNKLTDMSISKKAWVYAGVSNLGINRTDCTMKIADTLYKYNDNITILDGDEFVPVADLAEQDELTIRGYEETIWSITVTKGHGTVMLEDYGDFLGDNITIGYESMQQITEGMEITVREGDFDLTVENGQFSATKRIRVNRNLITYVSLADLGPEAPKHGMVSFDITPFGADLYIDNELTSYANPVELLYGAHEIKVSAGGYNSYEGSLNLDSTGKSLKIDLSEAASSEDASVSETDTQNSGAADNGAGTGSTTTDNNSEGSGDGASGSDSGSADSGSGTADTGTDSDISGDSSNEIEITDPDHQVYIQNPVGASVYIDGEYMGTSPCSFKKNIGSRVITFIEEGFETKSYTIEVANDGKDMYITYPALVPVAR